jgi:hypothetical protein
MKAKENLGHIGCKLYMCQLSVHKKMKTKRNPSSRSTNTIRVCVLCLCFVCVCVACVLRVCCVCVACVIYHHQWIDVDNQTWSTSTHIEGGMEILGNQKCVCMSAEEDLSCMIVFLTIPTSKLVERDVCFESCCCRCCCCCC